MKSLYLLKKILQFHQFDINQHDVILHLYKLVILSGGRTIETQKSD